MTVNFWSFAKKVNSTAIPSGTPLYSATAYLKEESGVLSPTLQIYESAAWNPYNLNYAQITDFARYYFTGEWIWMGGLWETTLEIDALGSWKTEIGNANKYILRSASAYNPDIIDSLYPPEEHVNVSWDSFSFPFYNDFTGGVYILGVINGQGQSLAGTTDYFIMTAPEIKDFMTYMIPASVTTWGNLNSMTADVYKSVYDPLRFIVSCKYFPFTAGGINTDVAIAFGNFLSNKYAEPLDKPNTWPTFTHDYTLPTGWTSRDARERSEPYADIMFWMNPFGVIPLSTSDFTLTDTVRVKITPDMISGEATIQIYAVVSGAEVLVAQQTAMIGFDVNLIATNKDSSSAAASLISGGSGIAGNLLAGNAPGAVLSGLMGAGDAFASLTRPSVVMSTRGAPSVSMISGASRLYSRHHTFPGDSNVEFGRPLYDVRQISSLSGYIKIGDPDFEAAGAMKDEIQRIGEFFTSGFYYE